MESRSWYTQFQEVNRIIEKTKAEQITAADFEGNRKERRAKASKAKREAKKEDRRKAHAS